MQPLLLNTLIVSLKRTHVTEVEIINSTWSIISMSKLLSIVICIIYLKITNVK